MTEPAPDNQSTAKDEEVRDAIVLTDPMGGSLAGDRRKQIIGLLLIVGGWVVLMSPVIPPGGLRFVVDLGCLLAMLFGVVKAVIASRRIRIRNHRAKPQEFWKEALRAEYEGNFSEAARLYREIAILFPNTAFAEDATSSIDILTREHKIPLDSSP